jgi:hypothetical protein
VGVDLDLDVVPVCARHWRQCRRVRIAGGRRKRSRRMRMRTSGSPSPRPAPMRVGAGGESIHRRRLHNRRRKHLPPPWARREKQARLLHHSAPLHPRLDCHRTAGSDVGVARRLDLCGPVFCFVVIGASHPHPHPHPPAAGAGGAETRTDAEGARGQRGGRCVRRGGVHDSVRAHRPCGPVRILGGRWGRRVRMYTYVEESSCSHKGGAGAGAECQGYSECDSTRGRDRVASTSPCSLAAAAHRRVEEGVKWGAICRGYSRYRVDFRTDGCPVKSKRGGGGAMAASPALCPLGLGRTSALRGSEFGRRNIWAACGGCGCGFAARPALEVVDAETSYDVPRSCASYHASHAYASYLKKSGV